LESGRVGDTGQQGQGRSSDNGDRLHRCHVPTVNSDLASALALRSRAAASAKAEEETEKASNLDHGREASHRINRQVRTAWFYFDSWLRVKVNKTKGSGSSIPPAAA